MRLLANAARGLVIVSQVFHKKPIEGLFKRRNLSRSEVHNAVLIKDVTHVIWSSQSFPHLSRFRLWIIQSTSPLWSCGIKGQYSNADAPAHGVLHSSFNNAWRTRAIRIQRRLGGQGEQYSTTWP
jgi:hypothetical protein